MGAAAAQTVGIISGEFRRLDKTLLYGGATWYRAILPALMISEKTGVRVVAGMDGAQTDEGLWIRDFATGELVRPDVLVCVRWHTDETASLLRSAREAGQRVVVDWDDALWCVPPSNAAYKISRPDLRPDDNYVHALDASAVADVVVASTERLASELWRRLYKRLAGSLVVVENFVRLRDWARPYSYGRRVGWTGSTGHRDVELRFLVDLFARLRRRGWRTVHVGPGRIPGASNVAPIHPSEWHLSAAHYDVGVAVCADSSFSRCKSDIKLLEYAAANKPAVACGFPYRGWPCVVSRPDEVFDAVERLRDGKLAEEVAAQLHDIARTRDVERRWTEFADAWGVASDEGT